MNILIIASTILLVWWLRGKHDKKNDIKLLEAEKANKEKQRICKSATVAVKQMREICNKSYEGTFTVGYIERENWLNLFRDAYYRRDILAEIGTSKEELDHLDGILRARENFCALMRELVSCSTESAFNTALTKRSELLKERGETLANFGIINDDSEGLRRKFFLRLAKKVESDVRYKINDIERLIFSLKTKGSTLGLENEDFGLPEVERRLKKLLTLK